MKKIFLELFTGCIATLLAIFTLALLGFEVSIEKRSNAIQPEKFIASLSGENVFVISPPGSPSSGKILYCIRDSCYWVDQAVAQYIDSLRTEAQAAILQN